MAQNHALKKAARALQEQNPGMPYTAALREAKKQHAKQTEAHETNPMSAFIEKNREHIPFRVGMSAEEKVKYVRTYTGTTDVSVICKELFPADYVLFIEPSGEKQNISENGLDGVEQDEEYEPFRPGENFYDNFLNYWSIYGDPVEKLSLYGYKESAPATVQEYELTQIWWELGQMQKVNEAFDRAASSSNLDVNNAEEAQASYILTELERMDMATLLTDVLSQMFDTQHASYFEDILGEYSEMFSLEFMALLARPYAGQYAGWDVATYQKVVALWNENSDTPIHPDDTILSSLGDTQNPVGTDENGNPVSWLPQPALTAPEGMVYGGLGGGRDLPAPYLNYTNNQRQNPGSLYPALTDALVADWDTYQTGEYQITVGESGTAPHVLLLGEESERELALVQLSFSAARKGVVTFDSSDESDDLRRAYQLIQDRKIYLHEHQVKHHLKLWESHTVENPRALAPVLVRVKDVEMLSDDALSYLMRILLEGRALGVFAVFGVASDATSNLRGSIRDNIYTVSLNENKAPAGGVENNKPVPIAKTIAVGDAQGAEREALAVLNLALAVAQVKSGFYRADFGRFAPDAGVTSVAEVEAYLQPYRDNPAPMSTWAPKMAANMRWNRQYKASGHRIGTELYFPYQKPELAAGDVMQFMSDKAGRGWRKYTVAASTDRFTMLTAGEGENAVYTIIDWARGVRGAHNNAVNGYRAQEAPQVLEALESGEAELSERNNVLLDVAAIVRGRNRVYG